MAVPVTDKRNKYDDIEAPYINDEPEPVVADAPAYHVENVAPDPATLLIDKTFKFVIEQPEFYHILQLSRGERKLLAKHIAKIMTTFPHFSKVGNREA